MIAGGASFAPSLWSFPAFAADTLNKSGYSSTAFITAHKNKRNCLFSCGDVPGSSKFIPSSVLIDQLLCLPEPLTPANGFSWSKQYNPCLSATFFITSIVNWLLSVAMFVVLNIGANSCWPGATSLCFVLADIPSFQSSSSRSFMYAEILGLITPK